MLMSAFVFEPGARTSYLGYGIGEEHDENDICASFIYVNGFC